ncbi:MAG: hypothetical protein V6Z89_17080 [Desulfobacter sp.]
MAPPCLYLDINDTGISACVGTDASPDQVFSLAYADLAVEQAPPDPETPEADLPAGQEDSPGTQEASPLTAALDRLAAETDISGCSHAVVMVPPSWISFRHTSLPFVQDKKIRQVLSPELSQGLPDPDQPFLLDFHVLDARFEEGHHLIFAGAMAEEKMEEIFTGLLSLGISTKVVTPRGCAQAMAFVAGQDEIHTFVHIHIADRETVLTLVMDGQPLVVRPLADNTARKDPKAMAVEVRKTLVGAGLRAGSLRDAFSGITVVIQGIDPDGDIAARIRDALDLCFKPATGPGPATPAGPGLDDICVIAQDPWPEAIGPDTRPPYLFNFCVGPYQSDALAGRYRRHVVACIVLALLAFSLGVAGLYRQSALLEDRVSQLRQASAALYKETFPKAGAASVAAPLLLMESRVKQARKEKAGNKEGEAWQAGANVRVMDILHDLSGRIPKTIDMEISRLVLNHGRLILTGATGNFNDVDKIKGLIQASPRFKTVTINSAESDKSGKQVRFKFILEM